MANPACLSQSMEAYPSRFTTQAESECRTRWEPSRREPVEWSGFFRRGLRPQRVAEAEGNHLDPCGKHRAWLLMSESFEQPSMTELVTSTSCLFKVSWQVLEVWSAADMCGRGLTCSRTAIPVQAPDLRLPCHCYSPVSQFGRPSHLVF